jgi:precorrin-6Y C5,15-methyltransferase (decarboxylating)
MPQVYLIGIGMGNPDTLTVRAHRLIAQSDCLIGARRMLDSADNENALRFPSIQNEEMVRIIASQPQNSIISVLLSGDVGFYSAAKKLTGAIRAAIPQVQLEQISGISSLQYFCAKVQTSWDDVTVVSVHGRSANVAGKVRSSGKVFVLTGSNQTAQEVCRSLCENNMGDALVWVGENLSYPEETISHGTAQELSEQSFSSLAVMLIEGKVVPRRSYPPIGLEDEEFLRNTEGKTVPMTKQEVRAVAMSKLRVEEDSLVYDVGAGTGSVTVESALLAKEGTVFAIEKNPQAVSQLRQNIQHFHLGNVRVIEGLAPQAMQELPPPDRVFIGGSSGQIEPILRLCLEKNPQVRMVVTAITLETVAEILSAVKSIRSEGINLELDISQISASRAKTAGQMHLMMGQNPVYICCMGAAEAK